MPVARRYLRPCHARSPHDHSRKESLSDKIEHVGESAFEADIIDHGAPVLVDFWAPWCGPCKAMMPLLDEIAEEYDGRLTPAKVNADSQAEIARRRERKVSRAWCDPPKRSISTIPPICGASANCQRTSSRADRCNLF
ncbi:thioredoxin family protein [Bradyrhizobium sp. USDA 4369]